MNSSAPKIAKWERLFPLINFVFVISLIIFIIDRDFPLIGHDYRIHIPRMLDTYLYNRVNGMGIQWFTPSFGGGLPAYPDPLYIQYSLPQFLMLVVNPWWALMLSLIIYSAVGFTFFYLLLKNELGLINQASVLGATFILANGFYVEHAIVGHVGYQQFPLLGVILYLIFSQKLNWVVTGVLLGIIGAILVNQAGFYLIFIFVLSLSITVPLIHILSTQTFNGRRLILSFSSGTLFALLFSASKLNAVYSFMRFFPRIIADNYSNTYLKGMGGIAVQLSGFFAIVPYYLITGKNINDVSLFFQKAVGTTSYEIWELDTFISPAIFILLIAGLFRFVFLAMKRKIHFPGNKLVAMVFLFFGIWLTADFSLSQGWLYQLLKPLPIIQSLHVNVRFTSAFIFPLAFLGAFTFHTLYKDKENRSKLPFLLLSGFSILALVLFSPLSPSVHRRNFGVNPSLRIYSKIDQGNTFPVNRIANIPDDKVFAEGSSNLYKLDDAIFGYDLEYFKPELTTGSIQEISDGYYNMTNPVSYVFPEENNLRPFERFRVNQLNDLENFTSRRPFQFKISMAQKVSNFINIAALFGLFLYASTKSMFMIKKRSAKSTTRDYP